MDEYNGAQNERPQGGGSYNNRRIGHEVNNFTNCAGTFYGFAQGTRGAIDIEKQFSKISKRRNYAEDILVIWVVKQKKVVGWYKNARVYRKVQHLNKTEKMNRKYGTYNIVGKESNGVILLPKQDRQVFKMNFGIHSDIWYGDDETNEQVIKFIKTYKERKIREIDSETITGDERMILAKARINQSEFRTRLLRKYDGKCCLCGMSFKDALIASHIKPWAESNTYERTSPSNGLLLCANHDKLFDRGHISFENDGKIIISSDIGRNDREKLNINNKMRIDVDEGMIPFLEFHRNGPASRFSTN